MSARDGYNGSNGNGRHPSQSEIATEVGMDVDLAIARNQALDAALGNMLRPDFSQPSDAVLIRLGEMCVAAGEETIRTRHENLWAHEDNRVFVKRIFDRQTDMVRLVNERIDKLVSDGAGEAQTRSKRESLSDENDAIQDARLELLKAEKVRLATEIAAQRKTEEEQSLKLVRIESERDAFKAEIAKTRDTADRAMVKAQQARRWVIAGKTGGALTGAYGVLEAALRLAGEGGVIDFLHKVLGGH